jgi:hypothetical protein
MSTLEVMAALKVDSNFARQIASCLDFCDKIQTEIKADTLNIDQEVKNIMESTVGTVIFVNF